MRILFATGGSGGHVYPVVAVARAVGDLAAQSNKAIEMEIIGSSDFFKDITDLNIPIRRTLEAKLRRYFSLLNILDAIKLPIVFLQSLFYVWKFMPDIVFAKGGYGSYMPALVARLFFIPVFIHESDSVPGAANKMLAKHAKKIFISFESSAKYFDPSKTMLVGDPIRQELLTSDKVQGLAYFTLTDQKPIILVTGGSQGAEKINKLLHESLVELTFNYQIIHQCGQANYAAINKLIDETMKEGQETYGANIRANYRLYPFLNPQELALAYAACDIVISRAGSGSLFELAALGKPGIIIPIAKSGGDHQVLNAVEFSKFGGVVLEEQNLTPLVFIKSIDDVFTRRTEISASIKAFAKPDAAQLIAGELLK